MSEAEREQLREQLLTAATENAREQAEQIAAAEGRSVGPAISLATDDPVGFESIVEESLATEVSAAVDGGPIEFTASVDATYELD